MDKHKIDIVIVKQGEMVYFSQLDLVRILERALRRTDLPLYYTRGFNPRVKISFQRALKLGVEGAIQTSLYFTESIPLQRLLEDLSPQLPAGLRIEAPGSGTIF